MRRARLALILAFTLGACSGAPEVTGPGTGGVPGQGGEGAAGAPGLAGNGPGGSRPGTPIAYASGPRREEPGDSEWPQLAYSGINVGTTTGRLPEKPELLFDVTVDGEIAYTTPVVAEGKLYCALYPGGLVALDAATGALVWQNKSLGNSKYGAAAYDDGRVFIVTTSAAGTAVVAVDAASGAMLWSSPASFVGILKLDRGVLYHSNGHVTALDAATGDALWTSADPCAAPPAIDGDRVYCLGAGELLALDAASGSRIYAAPAATTEASAYSAPAISGDRLYFVGARLYAHALSDGAALWDVDFGAYTQAELGNLTQTSPTVAYGKVMVVGSRGLYALDAGTGDVVWQAPHGRAGSTVAVADGRVVVSGVALLDADTGAELWTAGAGRYSWNPIVTDGHIYAGAFLGHILGWGGPVAGPPPAY
jgi:outer membrane protein assembly factor BamB